MSTHINWEWLHQQNNCRCDLTTPWGRRNCKHLKGKRTYKYYGFDQKLSDGCRIRMLFPIERQIDYSFILPSFISFLPSIVTYKKKSKIWNERTGEHRLYPHSHGLETAVIVLEGLRQFVEKTKWKQVLGINFVPSLDLYLVVGAEDEYRFKGYRNILLKKSSGWTVENSRGEYQIDEYELQLVKRLITRDKAGKGVAVTQFDK